MTAQIIEFKPRTSTAFENLRQFFEVCETVETCNFYLDSVETLAANNDITEKEMYTLRRIGRQKRIQLAHPQQKAPEKVKAPGQYSYTPEMGETKPECQIEAQLAYGGGHYYLKTKLELKGRGIRLSSTDKKGFNWYYATYKAYDKIKTQYTVSYEMALD